MQLRLLRKNERKVRIKQKQKRKLHLKKRKKKTAARTSIMVQRPKKPRSLRSVTCFIYKKDCIAFLNSQISRVSNGSRHSEK